MVTAFGSLLPVVGWGLGNHPQSWGWGRLVGGPACLGKACLGMGRHSTAIVLGLFIISLPSQVRWYPPGSHLSPLVGISPWGHAGGGG